jgi:hypothetical protein
MRYEIQGTDRAGNTRCQVMPASYDAKTVLLALAIRQMLWPEKRERAEKLLARLDAG